jgi:L-threonylcarbamoyladenylate synthase
METRTLPADLGTALEQAVIILREGGLVAFPTDTVYGLGALAFDDAAVRSIYQAKGRPAEKAIPVLLGDFRDLEQIASAVPDMARKLAAHFWPGPLTLVVPKNPALPEAVSGTPGVAVRIPAHPAARALLRLTGPMAVSSANLSGQSSPVTAQEVALQLGGRIPLVLDGGKSPGGLPSTLVDCMGQEPAILRQGPVGMPELMAALGTNS